MTNRTLVWLVASLAMLGPGGPARAQEPAAPAERELSSQVEELNRTLHEIADLLRKHLEGQQVDQLMKRIDMQTRSLAPLEQELRDARAERHGVAESLREIEAHVEFLDEQMRDTAQQPISMDDSSYAAERKRLAVQVELLRERLEASDATVYELEDRLQARRNEIRAWEELVDEALGLR